MKIIELTVKKKYNENDIKIHEKNMKKLISITKLYKFFCIIIHAMYKKNIIKLKLGNKIFIMYLMYIILYILL